MDEWFNDPFFSRDSMGSGGIHEQMDRMMNSMFSGFGDFFGDRREALEDGRQQRRAGRGNSGASRHSHNPHDTFGSSRTRGPTVEEVDDDASSRCRQQPIVEEPDDSSSTRSRRREPDAGGRRGQPQGYFYSSSMSSYMGPGGVQQTRKKVYDSTTGVTEMAEMRRLGDQAVAMHREVDRDGRTTDKFDRKNVDESQVGDFQDRWNSKAGSGTRSLGRSGGSSHHRALK